MRRDEDGSLVLALAVLMILTTLALAVLARSIAGLTEARRTQDSAAALAAAEAGLADAAVHIGLDPTSDQTGNGTLHAAGFDWAAQRVDAAHFTVTSTGTAGAVTRKVAGNVSRPSRFPYALFSDQDLAVDGAAVTIADGAVGSNHALTVSSSAGTRQEWFSPSGSCSGCPSGQSGVGPWRLALPTAPDDAMPCPAGGVLTGVVPRGVYVCDSVTFDGPVTLAPGTDPLVLYVSGSVQFNGGAVNDGGSATDLQLFVGGDEVRMGEAAAASFVGAVEAPSARLVLGDWQVDVTGAVSIGSVAARPGFHTFRHDAALDDVQLGGWALGDWHQRTNS